MVEVISLPLFQLSIFHFGGEKNNFFAQLFSELRNEDLVDQLSPKSRQALQAPGALPGVTIPDPTQQKVA